MRGDVGQFTIRKEQLAHRKQLKKFTARYLLLPNGYGMAVYYGICPCSERLVAGASRPVYTVKRNLHQIERGKTIIYLCLMLISVYMFVFLCVGSLMSSLLVTCCITRLHLECRYIETRFPPGKCIQGHNPCLRLKAESPSPAVGAHPRTTKKCRKCSFGCRPFLFSLHETCICADAVLAC
jgi:hypothetical protein